MNPIFLQIGSFKLSYYGLCYAIAFFVGIELLKKEAEKKGLSKALVEDYAFVAMISGLLGGRLYYVLFNFSYYLDYPMDILAVWKGGMAIHGGILGGFIGTLIYAHRKKLNAFLLGDMVAPLLLLGQGIGRFGNLANGEVHGVPTFTPLNIIFKLKPSFNEWYSYYNTLSLSDKAGYKELVPWGLVFPTSSPAGSEFPNLPLHPAMLYEAGLNFAGFIFLYFYMRNKNYATGTIWWTYIIIYSINRIVVSFFRAEDLMLLGVRAPHIVSFVMLMIAAVIIIVINKKSRSDKK
ncbi:MAG: prolipoprotein diacylglyceryl transferase [Cetobacterium sp.]|uniref:prolipoprotein diacylglyceryl transferase n=1 Tax=unclassified Cetobacterium TaxID=2630983 RepID=UPI000648B5D4|nr:MULTISPECIES: prolipoprotein diacylglyceryl transferase [unclassified Cetobacterium]